MDRVRNKIIDVTVSKKRSKSIYRRMALRLERAGYKVEIMCTDGYEGYKSYSLAARHVVSKSETALVESKNSLIRHFLARFNRKTRRFSKAFDMIFHSLMILIHKDLLLSILT